ncbi:MAG: hypothetical protein JNM84_06080, partial [Planctomycetes bacterium]|nr:hypothetical protein [Planctomycetota bacterium]
AVLFSALVNGVWELWTSDGTAAGTTRSAVIPGLLPSSGPSKLTSLGSRVLFLARFRGPEELWVSDGTAAGTQALASSSFSALQVVGGRAYFPGYDPATGTEVWVTDGTPAGTQLVIDLVPGGGFFGGSSPWFVGALRGEVYFFATSPAGRSLFRSNGTSAGTFAVAPIANDGSYYAENWGTPIGSELWFKIVSGPSPRGLYRTDGTAPGTRLVTTLDTQALAAVPTGVLLSGDDGSPVGRELYHSDGTPGGTILLLDLVPAPVSLSSNPIPIGAFRGQALVYAEEAASGRELWLSDGTPTGTRLLADLEPGSGSFSFLGVAANERQVMILGQSASSDAEPRFSDGTAAGTYQLDLFPANFGFLAQAPAAFGERFAFAGSLPTTGFEPWITDGTPAGTRLLADLRPGSASSSPEGWFPFGDRLLFRASIGAGELWLCVTDGTSVGTLPLARIDTASSLYPAWAPVIFADRVWFAAASTNAGLELWSTDGTSAGTALAFDLEPGPGSSRPSELAVAGDHLVARVVIANVPRVVSISGTPLRAQVLALTASELGGPYALDARRVALLTRASSTAPVQFWSCDGTDAGTTFAENLGLSQTWLDGVRPGAERLLFAQSDPALGYELWSSAGVPGTTVPVTSFDHLASYPRDFVRAGERLLFSAEDGVHGRELFSIRYASTGDFVASRYGSGCAGSNGRAPSLAVRGAPRWSTGAPFFLDLADAAPNAAAILLWSQERAPIALPGCTLWVGAPLGSIAAVTGSTGAFSLSIALVPDVIGELFAVQGFVLDPGGAAFGAAAATSGMELVIGR